MEPTAMETPRVEEGTMRPRRRMDEGPLPPPGAAGLGPRSEEEEEEEDGPPGTAGTGLRVVGGDLAVSLVKKT